MSVKVKVLVTLWCLTLCEPMDCSPPDFSVQVILQARILEWVAIPFSRGSSPPRYQTRSPELQVLFTVRVPKEALAYVSVQLSCSLCPTLCDPMNCSTPGLPVHHKLPESTQTHAHQVGDAIQPSHPLSSPSPPAPNPSQHQGLFQ